MSCRPLSRAGVRLLWRSTLCGPAVASVLIACGCVCPAWAQGTTPPAAAGKVSLPVFQVLDPQRIVDQDEMTWDDYHAVPGVDWADTSRKPARTIRVALITADFDDQPFVMTMKKGSDLFGNPQVDPVKREDISKFYADFWSGRSPIHHGHTVNEYWMEQSHGRIGVSMTPYGPYHMPKKLFQYGLGEFRQNQSAPTGFSIDGNLTRDCDALWSADAGANIRQEFDLVLRIFAGYDETCVWQEFGEMKFQTRDDITPEFGNPDPTMPRWAPTRYEPWTSWKAAEMPWSNSAIINGESSGSIVHEVSHAAFRIGDNNNNPYAAPYRRVGSGPWDIMDRGSFNGPGGPHKRFLVPVLQGGAMPAGLMLRQKMNFKFIDPPNVVQLSREGLAKSGLAVATILSRTAEPGPNGLAGMVVNLDGPDIPIPDAARAGGRGGAGAATTKDRTPWIDPATDPLSQGVPNFNNYTLEIVQRIGYDSFCPDSGVLIAKNKDQASANGGPNSFAVFNWVIDAHPEDSNKIDFKQPNGEPVMRTVADYRQLNDALFHAGLNSGSKYEWEDTPNRLHFYVIDAKKDEKGFLWYTVGVKSLDGSGPQARGVALAAPAGQAAGGPLTRCVVTLSNTGKAAQTDPSLHPADESACLGWDIYRLSAECEDAGWSAQLQNELVAVKFGESVEVPVWITRKAGAAGSPTVVLTAISESDTGKKATARLQLRGN